MEMPRLKNKIDVTLAMKKDLIDHFGYLETGFDRRPWSNVCLSKLGFLSGSIHVVVPVLWLMKYRRPSLVRRCSQPLGKSLVRSRGSIQVVMWVLWSTK